MMAASTPFQVMHVFKKKSTRDISWFWIAQYTAGLSMIYIYAHLENLAPVWIPMSIELACVFTLFFYKVKLDLIQKKIYSEDAATQTDNVIEIDGISFLNFSSSETESTATAVE